MTNELISVIIPVYNVCDYLNECLDSVVRQTYSNLEIIIIDDGSTDGSGRICDEYANKDSRIIVVHKENSGLSCARNAALDIAHGKYIGFVDSDDYVDENLFYSLLSAAEENECDISICNDYMFSETEKIVECPNVNKTLLDSDEAIKELITDSKIKNYMWNKLFRAELFQDLRFPEGRSYEDMAVCYLLFDKANRIVVTPDALYYYRIREGSISYHKGNEQKWYGNLKDIIEVKKERMFYLKGRTNYSLEERALASMIPSLFAGIRLAKKYSDKTQEDLYRLFLKKNWKAIWMNSFVREKDKFLLFIYSSRLFYSLYDKING